MKPARVIPSIIVLLAFFVTASQPTAADPGADFFNVRQYGATGDGSTLDTRAIQKAIEACHEKGGGTVYVPAGIYLCGTIRLKDNITLYLDNGAVVKASPNDGDFDPYEKLNFHNDADHETSYFHFSLIRAEDVQRIAIVGNGIIDGNRRKRGGPKMIALKRCKYVSIKDVTIRNAPNYAISLLGTDYVNIDGVNILNGYCDGIDPDACRYVRIANCYIESWDDAIVPKTSFSLGTHRSTEYLTVTNCQLATNCVGFKLGTESGGDFKYITVSNCVIKTNVNAVPKGDSGRPPISGISLETVDGAHIDGVTISNISMSDVRYPIFLRLGNRGRDMDTPIPGTLKNVIISDIVATNALNACLITGIPDHPIENIMIDNISVTCKGGGSREQARATAAEKTDRYPSATMFGDLPAWAIYCRHVQGLSLSNIRLSLDKADMRSAVICDDVSDLQISSFTAQQSEGGDPMLQFRNVRNAFIYGCMLPQKIEVFLNVSGERSKGIVLKDNSIAAVRSLYQLDDDVSAKSVSVE